MSKVLEGELGGEGDMEIGSETIVYVLQTRLNIKTYVRVTVCKNQNKIWLRGLISLQCSEERLIYKQLQYNTMLLERQHEVLKEPRDCTGEQKLQDSSRFQAIE